MYPELVLIFLGLGLKIGLTSGTRDASLEILRVTRTARCAEMVKGLAKTPQYWIQH